MKISFADKKLKKYADDERLARKKLGDAAEKFKQRLENIYNAETLDDLRFMPGRYHELIGDRKGQWACDLNKQFRLVFTPQEHPIPTDENGKYIWIEITAVEILEIVDYH